MSISSEPASPCAERKVRLGVIARVLLLALAFSSAARAEEPIVDINPDPLGGFEPGAPAEMEALAWMAGEWEVESSFRSLGQSTEWFPTGRRKVRYESVYGGAFLTAAHDVAWADGSRWAWTLLISYDRFQQLYRLAVWDDQWALLDIYEGRFEEDSLAATNEETGTFGPGGPQGEMTPAYLAIQRDEDDAFRFEWLARDRRGELLPLIRLTHHRTNAGRATPTSSEKSRTRPSAAAPSSTRPRSAPDWRPALTTRPRDARR